MGKKFGNLQRLHGVIMYSLSPNELKPFKGFFNPGFKNLLRKIKENIFFIGIPALAGYSSLEWAERANYEFHRKNPKDYENDV